MICTLGNYEYVFAYIFDQAAGIELEVRATGILSTTPLDNQDGTTVPWATNVAPDVSAPYHQHLFSFRIDPAVDGFRNTVIYEESEPLPQGPENLYGAGYRSVSTTIQTSGAADTSVDRHRVFKIRNDSKINPITHKPVAYKLHSAPSQMLLNRPESFNHKRAVFATRPIWVTKHDDDELFAGGEFTNQSKSSEGVDRWSQRGDSVENEDLVLWHSEYTTHIPLITLLTSRRSFWSDPQPPHRRLPSHANGADQRCSEARWFLRQEPCTRCAALQPGFQQVYVGVKSSRC